MAGNRIILALLSIIAIELGALLLRPLVTPASSQSGGTAITTVAAEDGHIEFLVAANGYLSEWVSTHNSVDHSMTDQEWQAAMTSGKLVMLDAKPLPRAAK